MQKLVLQKQESLTTLLLQCQNLQEMDLSDCESLMDSICEVFSDGGGCPKLRSLVLDNCEVCNLCSHCFSLIFMNFLDYIIFSLFSLGQHTTTIYGFSISLLHHKWLSSDNIALVAIVNCCHM